MEPSTIQDQAVPLLTGGFTPVTGQVSTPAVGDAVVPTTRVDVAFPAQIIAQDTISTSINTETKAILGTFSFEQLGAIRIGQFSQGVQGEIDISPNGITAKNVNGTQTFALDGTTGNASFLGTLEAAGFTIADETGLHSVNNFASGSYNSTSLFGTTSTSLVDVTNATLTTPVFTRPTQVLVMFGISAYLTLSTDVLGFGTVYLAIDGTAQTSTIFEQGFQDCRLYTPGVSSNDSPDHNLTAIGIITLQAGAHILKLQANVFGASTTLALYKKSLLYVVLGS